MPDCQCVVMHVGAAHTFDVVSSRGWLCNPGDCCSAQHLLHCCVGLGHLLPVQLLHLGSAVGFLQQHLEHKWEAPFITRCACYTSSIDRSHFKKISLTIKLWGGFLRFFVKYLLGLHCPQCKGIFFNTVITWLQEIWLIKIDTLTHHLAARLHYNLALSFFCFVYS